MNFKAKLLLNKGTQRFLTIVIYLLFVFFMIKLMVEESQISVQISYLIILLLFGFFGFYYELLKWFYDRATISLIALCDPEKGKHYMGLLKKYDFLKSYKISIHIFNLLLFRDLGQQNKTLEYLDSIGKKTFSSSFDLLLVYYFSLFDVYCALNDKEKADEYFKHVMALKGKKIGYKKISPLFSWDEIQARHQYLHGHYKASRELLNVVNVESMNRRERAYFYMISAKVEYALKNFKNAKKNLALVFENGGLLKIVDEATALKTKC